MNRTQACLTGFFKGIKDFVRLPETTIYFMRFAAGSRPLMSNKGAEPYTNRDLVNDSIEGKTMFEGLPFFLLSDLVDIDCSDGASDDDSVHATRKNCLRPKNDCRRGINSGQFA